MSTSPALLTNLLPSTPYLLAFSLPLLLVSVVLTFAGAFLTLDRTRSFAPSYDAIPGGFDQRHSKKRRFNWLLEGGIGGLAAGYAFGVHCSTFLALLIPSLTTSTALTDKSFIPVWLFPAIVMTLLAGRWKYVALAVSGISGGATLALSINVIIHPSLLTRLIFMGIIVPPVTALTLLPFKRTHHASLRLALSSTGAFGLVLSIALLARIPAWANAWDRLWVTDSAEWGTSAEKGLDAAFCFFLLGGMACDWALKWKLGEDPDQKWDSYLATYATNLPDRAGNFRPLTSFWHRLFSWRHSTSNAPLYTETDIVFPSDADLKLPPPSDISTPIKLQNTESPFTPPPQFLRKPSRKRGFCIRKPRDAVKFKPGEDADSSDSDSDELDELKTPLPLPLDAWRRPVSGSAHSSSVTLNNDADNGTLDIDKEKNRVRAWLGREKEAEILDYSDYEEDVTTSANTQQVSRDAPGWSPGFLRRHSTHNSGSGSAHALTPIPVPATPSLIRAVDRLAAAQREAFGMGAPSRPGLPPSKSSEAGLNEGLPKVRQTETHRGPRWDEFWRDVDAKAAAASS